MNNFNIPKEKFAFIHDGERISDKKFEDKPIGYFKDAWIRFRKSKASVIAAIIIICIMLYSVLAPLLITTHDATFMCSTYAKKPGRITWLRDFGIATGGVKNLKPEAALVMLNAIAVGEEINKIDDDIFKFVKDNKISFNDIVYYSYRRNYDERT